MKHDKKLEEMINDFKQALVANEDTSNISVKFFINSGYEYGAGWTVDSKPFYEELMQIFMGNWNLTLPVANNGSAFTVKNRGDYLYLHPLEFSGYVNKSHIKDIEKMISKCYTFRYQGVKTFDTIYNISNQALLEKFSKEDILLPFDRLLFYFFKKPQRDSSIFDYIYQQSKIKRVDDFINLSSLDYQYVLMQNEIKTLLRFNKLIKDENNLISVPNN